MDSVISKKVTFISYSMAFIFIISMITAAVMLKDHQLILPEAAAMAVAMWVYREEGWIRQPSKIFLAPSFTAAIGFVVNHLNIPYLGKVSLTIVLLMLFMRIIQSNLAPSIATGLLPLVVNANEWSFIISVFIETFILMLGVLVFGLNKGLEKKVKINYRYMLVFLVLTFVWMGLCWLVGYEQLAVIPPILVVVYESLQKPMYIGKMAFKQGLVLTISATVGTLVYLSIDLWIVATILDMLLMLILLRIVGMRMPAAYGFTLLPFVFPKDNVTMLPLVSLVASVFLLSSVLVYKKIEMKRRTKAIQMLNNL
ncbi:hypothetical protein [Paenibacillus humicola]|uniref:hypothetical protein n=1 Tax=Paenibacillus humicola TaxID=3110540 RepID=UPI00237AFA2C|nr:hypothetical protein [Paenibacillus humicola]